MRKLLTLALTASLAVGLVGSAKAGRPTKVFEDPVGDAGIVAGPAVGEHAIPGFDQAGFDLVSGEIQRVGQNLEFKVTSAAMPATGSLPEGATFRWTFMVKNKRYRFTIKSQDIGKPDPVTQEGTERLGRIDIAGHFRLERCVQEGAISDAPLHRCKLVAFEDGFFDPANKSFSVLIPLTDIGATSGTVIERDTMGSDNCPCWVMHTAELTSPPGFTLDATNPRSVIYRVPPG
jgi:hypothetical protein